MHDADPNKADQSINKSAAYSVSGNTETDSNTIEQEYSSTIMDKNRLKMMNQMKQLQDPNKLSSIMYSRTVVQHLII